MDYTGYALNDIEQPILDHICKILDTKEDELKHFQDVSNDYKRKFYKSICDDVKIGMTTSKMLLVPRVPNPPYVVFRCRTNDSWRDFIIYKMGNLLRTRKLLKMHTVDSYELNRPKLSQDMWDVLDSNIFSLFRHRRQLKKKDITLKRGILLTGPPGNGKSMLMTYVYQFLNRKYSMTNFAMSGATFMGLKEDEALEKFNRSLVLMDDFDVSLFDRKYDSTNACKLLSCMDHPMFKKDFSVRIFSTNESMDSIDPAFMRPGRIDAVIEFKPPTEAARETFFIKDSLGVKLGDLIKETEGLSYAALQEVVNTHEICKLTGDSFNLGECLGHIISKDDYKRSKKIGGFSPTKKE